MGESAMQAARMSGGALHQPSSEPESQEVPVPSPAEPPSSSLSPGAPAAAREHPNTSPITVLTLLDKVVNMLHSVQETQLQMQTRQEGLEGSVKAIQGALANLAKSQASTSGALSQLLDKTRKVSAQMREVRERMDRQCAQVTKLEGNHSLLLRRNHFKVIISQEGNEIPTKVFVKEPPSTLSAAEEQEEPNSEKKTLEGTLCAAELSSDDEISHEVHGLDEKLDESRADKIKRSSLQNLGGLKKAFSRENISKKMSKITTRIVPPETREKFMKSLTQTHQKTSTKCSALKLSPLTFNIKKVWEGESPIDKERRPKTPAEVQFLHEHEKIPGKDLLSGMAITPTEEIKVTADSFDTEAAGSGEAYEVRNNRELSITKDHKEFEEARETSNCKEPEHARQAVPDDDEELSEEPTPHPAGPQVDQTA
ncbi:caveolae-associated protein 2-like [Ambystoma mexicanum]|uniref:caveolae-associated protein 2-like n=1 Tax=Ambystoma mexicanum TaxID=8296 RepID=UPI0037E95877